MKAKTQKRKSQSFKKAGATIDPGWMKCGRVAQREIILHEHATEQERREAEFVPLKP